MVLRLRKEKYKLQLEDAGKESLRQKIAELKTVIAGGNGEVVEAVTATCEDAGSLAYWRDPLSGAIFEDGSGMKSLTWEDVLVSPLGHDWGEPAYTWTGDNSSVTAKSICRRVTDHVLEETVNTMFASDSKSGRITWTAQFENGIFTTQTRSADTEPVCDESAYVTFDKAGTTTRKPVSEGTAKGDGLAFVIPVPAPEYADRITVKVYDGEDNPLRLESTGGTDHTKNGFEYSVKQYAQNKAASGSTKQMRALAKALDNYGTAAQIYFRYGDYSDLYADAAVTAVTLEDLAPYALTTSGTKPAGMTGASIVVEFDTDNTLRVTFKTDGSRTPGDYTFLLDGTETVPTKSGKNGYLQVKNIAAPNLDYAHTFTITDGTDTYTVKASALSYGYTSVKNGNEARRNLGKALYLYNQAADEMFGN